MANQQIHDMSVGELRSALEEAKTELFNLRFQREAGALENHSRLRVVRRNIARYYTILRQRELAAMQVQQENNDAE